MGTRSDPDAVFLCGLFRTAGLGHFDSEGGHPIRSPPLAIRHTIHEDLGIVVSTWTGPASDSELVSRCRELYEDERWRPGFHEVVDLREAGMAEVSGSALQALAEMVDSYAEGHAFKTAIVAPENLPFGLARMYEAYALESPESVKVFRELEDALEWIGIRQSERERLAAEE
jgi:hypothetical protein